jgi:hypothetical protein
MIKEKRQLYEVSAYKVVLMLKRDMGRIYNEVVDKFLWRNFSKYVAYFDPRALNQEATIKESSSPA